MKTRTLLVSSTLVLSALSSLLAPSLVTAAEEAGEASLESLQAEVNQLRSIVPGQAFAMTQIAYNFSNLWFAAQAGNWPLANFYLGETRVRLRWAVRIQPERRLSSGQLALDPIAKALEAGQMAKVAEAITAQDHALFASAYTEMMQGCQGCHVASEKPYLKLHIPTVPAEPMIDFTP